MTPREREIFFNGFMAGMSAFMSDRHMYVLDKILDAWPINHNVDESPVFKEIHEELRAIGATEEG